MSAASTSSQATFSAWVMTVTDRSRRAFRCRAISAVVVPESKITVSLFWMSSAAARQIRTFSAWCRIFFRRRGYSWVASTCRTAPPCERTAIPCDDRTSRSARAVTAEIENLSTRSPTVIWPFCSIRSAILRRRCSANKRESLPLLIRLILRGVGTFARRQPTEGGLHIYTLAPAAKKKENGMQTKTGHGASRCGPQSGFIRCL
jgi:hypothetical protein